MGLEPEQFWALDPKEFRLWSEAYRKKQRHLDRRSAWMQTNIINPWVKRNLKITDILPDDETDMILSKRDFVEAMNRRRLKERN